MHNPSTTYSRKRGLFVALLITLVWVPLPHGGERFWEIGPVAIISFLLLAIWSLHQWRSKSELPTIITMNRVPLALLLLWLLYVLFQTIPLSPDWLAWLSPHSADLKNSVPFHSPYTATGLSIDPGSTLKEFIKYTSYVTLFFLSLVLTDTRKRLITLAATLFLTGTALTLYSLINHYGEGVISLNQSIPPWGDPWSEAVRGTFSHRNHFAGFLEITIPLGICLLLVSIKNFKAKLRPNNRSSNLLNFITSPRLLLLGAVILMIIALFDTASRGGTGAFFIAITGTAILFSLLKRRKVIATNNILAIISIALILPHMSAEGGLGDRLEERGFSPNGRDLMTTAITSIISDFPTFGSGAGTYPYIQHKYKNSELGVSPMSKRAHNDYLELICDQGIPGIFLLGTALFLFFLRIISGVRKRRDHLMRGLLFGSVTGITSIMLHAAFEFNFQIPANAIYFWVLVSIGILATTLESANHRREPVR